MSDIKVPGALAEVKGKGKNELVWIALGIGVAALVAVSSAADVSGGLTYKFPSGKSVDISIPNTIGTTWCSVGPEGVFWHSQSGTDELTIEVLSKEEFAGINVLVKDGEYKGWTLYHSKEAPYHQASKEIEGKIVYIITNVDGLISIAIDNSRYG